MAENVIYLPGTKGSRATTNSLGLYIRVGFNDHVELLEAIAEGERGFFGLTFSAQHVKRHKALITEAQKYDIDLILDPKTAQQAFLYGHNPGLGAVPWGLPLRHHRLTDFEGAEGRERARQITEFASENGFTQLLGPTHHLSSANDPWLRRDIDSMGWVRDNLKAANSKIDLIYSLSMPIGVLRDRLQRRAILQAVADAPFDSIWLKIENFDANATGAKFISYVEACRDLINFDVPLVADHTGGLPGLGLLSFGAASGIAHGVTTGQGFQTNHWRNPPPKREQDGDGESGGPTWRVYIPDLELTLTRGEAKTFFDSSARIVREFVCGDTHCCNGRDNQIRHPARHFLYQRARQIEAITETPPSLRVERYLEKNVRRVSDDVASVASLTDIGEELSKRFAARQKMLGRFRKSVTNFARNEKHEATAVSLTRLNARRR